MEEKAILDVTEEIKDYIEKIMREECQFDMIPLKQTR